MTDAGSELTDPSAGAWARINPEVPHISRLYDYLLGGKDNYPADRKMGDAIIAGSPDTVAGVRANRGFLARAVEFLAGEVGIRQFLDIGTGLPSANNTHQVAQRVAPESRIVYVDNDPIVLAHAHALLTSAPSGVTAYVDADLRDVDKVLAEARKTLDFGQPIALMLIGVLHCVPDEDDPAGIVARLSAALPAGSWLALSHPATDLLGDQMSHVQSTWNRENVAPVTFRAKTDIERMIEGWTPVEPGLASTSRWRNVADPDASVQGAWAVVAHRP